MYQLRCRLNELCSLSLEWKEKTCDIPTGRTMSDSWGPTASDIAGARRLQSQVHWTAQYDDDALDTILEGVLPNDLDVPGHPSTPAGADDDADDDELEDDPDMYGLSDVDEEDASIIGELEEGAAFRADGDDDSVDGVVNGEWYEDEEFPEIATPSRRDKSPVKRARSPTKRTASSSRPSSPFSLPSSFPSSPTKRRRVNTRSARNATAEKSEKIRQALRHLVGDNSQLLTNFEEFVGSIDPDMLQSKRKPLWTKDELDSLNKDARAQGVSVIEYKLLDRTLQEMQDADLPIANLAALSRLLVSTEQYTKLSEKFPFPFQCEEE